MQDLELNCANPKCPNGGTFQWSVGEQRFMERLKETGKVTEIAQPKRCPDCRKERRARFNNNQQQ